MSNVFHISDKRVISQDTLETHLAKIADATDEEHPMMLSFIIDNNAGNWNVKPIISNMSNAESLLAIRLFEHALLERMKE